MSWMNLEQQLFMRNSNTQVQLKGKQSNERILMCDLLNTQLLLNAAGCKSDIK